MEQPDTILCQHKLTFTSPVTASSKEKLKTIEVREKFKDQPKLYAKYRHEIRHEFETNIMVSRVSIQSNYFTLIFKNKMNTLFSQFKLCFFRKEKNHQYRAH